jgi:hypothetical protein
MHHLPPITTFGEKHHPDTDITTGKECMLAAELAAMPYG